MTFPPDFDVAQSCHTHARRPDSIGMAAPGERCPRATEREQCTTGGLNSSGICEISASLGQYPHSRIPEHVRVDTVLRTRPPVGEEGEEVGRADDAVAVEVEVGWTAGVKALWFSNIHD